MNFPAISDPNAMARFPDARAEERDALLELVSLKASQRVLDVQAAGGFLSDEIDRRLAQEITCVCIEPCEQLGQRLNPRFEWLRDSVEHFCGVADSSIDVALGLAGLHHSESHRATVGEMYRVLKPGGELAICDVEVGSKIAAWLNDFVDRHNPSGHSGEFLQFGNTGNLLNEAGFTEVTEKKQKVPWRFEREEDVSIFFKALFGLDLQLEQVGQAVEDYFEVEVKDDGVSIDWQLIYCFGRKARELKTLSEK